MVEANTGPTSQSKSALPPDNPRRELSIINPDSLEARHISIVGDTYTILISGQDTDGRYCMIDMLVPTGGGPGPHRHDFEEMFSILEGEIELTFRGEKSLAKAGETVNIPANAPHFFKNVAAKPARLLCVCSPAGQDEFFMAIGKAVESRTTPAPGLSRRAGGVHGEGKGVGAKISNGTARARRALDTKPLTGSARGSTQSNRKY